MFHSKLHSCCDTKTPKCAAFLAKKCAPVQSNLISSRILFAGILIAKGKSASLKDMEGKV